MSEFKIELKTGNKFWTPKGLGALGMDPHRAIAELVANSLDWRRDVKDGVKPIINIILGKNGIEIVDNGVGMTSNELQNAIQVSVSNDELRKNLRIRKGMFGMGMKVACLSLGWKIEIYTRSINQKSKEHYLNLDTRKLDNNDEKNKYRDGIKGVTSIPKPSSPLTNWDSGTSIKIEDLIHKSINPISLRDSLQEIFSPEIGIENINISVIDSLSKTPYNCEKIEVPIFEDSKINLDDLNLFVKSDETGKKIQIKGWIALLKTSGSGGGKWGLHLFKNNQIIERNHQLPIRLGGLMPKNPHPELARTYGEIHLDMCKPSFHKVGFDYSTESWKAVQELLKDHINVIMEASRDYKKSDFEKAEQSIKVIQKHRKAAKQIAKKLKQHIQDENKPENAITLPDGQWFTIVDPIFENLSDTEKNKPWIYHFRDKSRELAIIINKKSPIYENVVVNNYHDPLLDMVVNWSICECLFLLLNDHFDYSVSDSINFRDSQLSILFKSVEGV